MIDPTDSGRRLSPGDLVAVQGFTFTFYGHVDYFIITINLYDDLSSFTINCIFKYFVASSITHCNIYIYFLYKYFILYTVLYTVI